MAKLKEEQQAGALVIGCGNIKGDVPASADGQSLKKKRAPRKLKVPVPDVLEQHKEILEEQAEMKDGELGKGVAKKPSKKGTYKFVKEVKDGVETGKKVKKEYVKSEKRSELAKERYNREGNKLRERNENLNKMNQKKARRKNQKK